MIPITQQTPKNNQKCLVDTGSEVAPAIYNADDGLFWRYPNYVEGDRCISYFYSSVLYWMPFPSPKKGGGFIVELELPFPKGESPEMTEEALWKGLEEYKRRTNMFTDDRTEIKHWTVDDDRSWGLDAGQ